MAPDLLVATDDLARTRVRETDDPVLEPGQARLRIEAFGLSANNVTYALTGDALGYWRFFPAPDGWGRVPVWGFAEVIESAADALPAGSRAFGMLPPSRSVVVHPDRVTARGFVDAAPHRAELPRAYNAYRLVGPAGRDDAAEMLLHPLFLTSYLLADLCEEGAEPAAILTSASSKTASATAFLLASAATTRVIGLTSPRNRAFVERLGVYDEVVVYDDLDTLASSPAALIDFAGDAALRERVASRLGAALTRSVRVGATHQGADLVAGGEVFFAPDRIAHRTRQWGRADFEARVARAWDAYATWAGGWLRPAEHDGLAAAQDAWRDTLANRLGPADRIVVRP